MDVILHLGAHRCGTTTLQRYMCGNKVTLADAGIEVWTPEETRRGLFTGLMRRPDDMSLVLKARARRGCGLVALQIDRLRQTGYRDLIISDENMIGAVRNNLRTQRFYPDAADRLAGLVPGIGGAPRRIGICIRAYDRYWASSLAYAITRGHQMPTDALLTALLRQPRRWRDLIADVAQVFPRSEVIVWPFERFASQPDTQLALLSGGLQIRPALRGAREWQNRSPDRAALRRLIRMRGHSPEMVPSLANEGSWMPFDAAQQATLRRDYAEDLQWLRAGADGSARFVDMAEPKASDMGQTDTSHNNLIYEMRGFVAKERASGGWNNDTKENMGGSCSGGTARQIIRGTHVENTRRH